MHACVCVMEVLLFGFLWFEFHVITVVVGFHLWRLDMGPKRAFCTAHQALVLFYIRASHFTSITLRNIEERKLSSTQRTK